MEQKELFRYQTICRDINYKYLLQIEIDENMKYAIFHFMSKKNNQMHGYNMKNLK